MDVNDKFKDVNLEEEFDTVMKEEEYHEDTKFGKRSSDIASLPEITSDYVKRTHAGDDKGWEKKYYYLAKEMVSNIFSSLLKTTKRLRRVDRIWGVLHRRKKRHPKEKPFYLKATNRGKKMVDNTKELAMVGREATKSWPCCNECKDALYWDFVPTDNERDKYIYWMDRIILCDNPVCRMNGVDIGLRASNLVFANEKATKLFQKRFKDDIAQRIKKYDSDSISIPKNLTRARTLKGLPHTKSSPKKFIYNDLANEDNPNNYIDIPG